jgi:flagellar hook-associated protein 1 FlgK
MPGLVQGLEIARRALLAHQSALNVIGNNLANVSTPGYTRQRAELNPSPSERTPDGLIGTGVLMEGVSRLRDVFIDTQIRDEMGLSGKWSARSDMLSRVESVLNEPSDAGLGSLLDNFWNSWLDLSNNPEDSAARAVVVQSGVSLAEGLKQVDFRLRQVIEATDTDLEARVQKLNSLFQEAANLNAQIRRAEVGGGIDANLRDRRDVILDQLAQAGGATNLVRMDGTIVVRMGGRSVVEGNNTTPLATMRYNDDGRVRVRVIFEEDKTSPSFLSGELAGLLEARDQVLPAFLEKMDQLTQVLTSTVNRAHEAGPSRLPFFNGTRAQFLEVAPEIANDPSQVNAGTTGDAGDNDIAIAIAALRENKVMSRGTASVSDFYRGAVSEIGSLGQQARFLSDSQANAVSALEASRQSVVGVNIDEELTRMITTQKAYEAAARVFTTVSDMLDTILRM